VTWDEAVEEFIATQEQRLRGKRTLDNHRWVLMGRAKGFAVDRGLTTVDQWNADAFESFHRELAEVTEVTDAAGRPYSTSTQHIHYRNLRQFMRFCSERECLADDHLGLTIRVHVGGVDEVDPRVPN
jgi:hypothetical protein